MKFQRADQPRPLEYISTPQLLHEVQSRFEHSIFITCPYDASRQQMMSYVDGDDGVCASMAAIFIQSHLADQFMDDDEDD